MTSLVSQTRFLVVAREIDGPGPPTRDSEPLQIEPVPSPLPPIITLRFDRAGASLIRPARYNPSFSLRHITKVSCENKYMMMPTASAWRADILMFDNR